MRGRHETSCQSCGITFQASRADAKYCSARCRQRARRKPQDFRSRLLGKALKAAGFLIGPVGSTRVDGKIEPVLGLLIPRAAALVELNHFLNMPEQYTEAELSAVLRSENIIDYSAGASNEATGDRGKRRRRSG